VPLGWIALSTIEMEPGRTLSIFYSILWWLLFIIDTDASPPPYHWNPKRLTGGSVFGRGDVHNDGCACIVACSRTGEVMCMGRGGGVDVIDTFLILK